MYKPGQESLARSLRELLRASEMPRESLERFLIPRHAIHTFGLGAVASTGQSLVSDCDSAASFFKSELLMTDMPSMGGRHAAFSIFERCERLESLIFLVNV